MAEYLLQQHSYAFSNLLASDFILKFTVNDFLELEIENKMPEPNPVLNKKAFCYVMGPIKSYTSFILTENLMEACQQGLKIEGDLPILSQFWEGMNNIKLDMMDNIYVIHSIKLLKAALAAPNKEQIKLFYNQVESLYIRAERLDAKIKILEKNNQKNNQKKGFNA